MSDAALAHKVTIMYCGTLPSHYLASTALPAVTQIRATDDYQPSFDQWRIGLNSLLASSLGLAPFKDTFWSTERQPGDPDWYWAHNEPNCELQLLVSVLSCGAVGVGDKIGLANKELLLRACRQDGLLLKPDKPATPLDKCFTSDGPSGELWDSFSEIGGQRWSFVFAANQKETTEITCGELGLPRGRCAALDTVARRISVLDHSHPLKVGKVAAPRAGAVPYQYFVIAPLSGDGVAFLGELNKCIAVSRQRFSEVSPNNKAVVITGLAGESIELSWLCPHMPKRFELEGNMIACGDRSQQESDGETMVLYDPVTCIVTLRFKVPQSGRPMLQLRT
jgi:hypothetical protein